MMLAKELIKDTVPPLKVSDDGNRALAWMEEFRVRFLPVIRNKEFLGLLSESDILKMEDHSVTIEKAELPLNKVYIYENQHLFDAIRFVSQFNYPIVPVLSLQNEYAGIITVNDLIDSFAIANGVMIPGGIIHLQIQPSEYIFSSLARIVESNDAAIVSLSSYPSEDGKTLEVILKVNRIDLTRILAALARNDYTVTGYYQQSEFSSVIKDRYDSLMSYLKV
ncbi:MAG: CBS domain-containing protein [Bacteroidia bacterium]|nr:CBS domain-containing protein [Bacteroidia bacterium]MCZ2276374.1 CBS domain-containing protein [Bacteroidia bacterium]